MRLENFQTALAAVTLVVAIMVLGVAWEALNIAKNQLERANRLTAASLTMSQWLSYIEACDADARVVQTTADPKSYVEQSILWTPWNRAPALEAMQRAVKRVANGETDEAVTEEFEAWRAVSDCPFSGPFIPITSWWE